MSRKLVHRATVDPYNFQRQRKGLALRRVPMDKANREQQLEAEVRQLKVLLEKEKQKNKKLEYTINAIKQQEEMMARHFRVRRK